MDTDIHTNTNTVDAMQAGLIGCMGALGGYLLFCLSPPQLPSYATRARSKRFVKLDIIMEF